MRVIGLTGGIASGKSTVARLCRGRGVPVIDADLLAREVVAPGQPALAELVTAFGPGILTGEGVLDRKRLGAIAFADPEARARLNAITHPRIAARTQAELAALRQAGAPLAIYEAALLVENGIHRGLDGLLVVAASPEVQLARLMARDGLDEAAARARLAAQAPLAAKLAAATWVIRNDGELPVLEAQLATLWPRITGEGGTRRG